jgi:hypothetical protein
MRTASHIEASGSTEMIGDVMTSLAFIGGSFPIGRRRNPASPATY